MPNFQGRYLKQGTSGTYGAESLPNITGSFEGMANRFFLALTRGAFGSLTNKNDANKIQQTGETLSGKQTYYRANFNANNSSSAYQDGAKVNPDNAEILYCIKY